MRTSVNGDGTCSATARRSRIAASGSASMNADSNLPCRPAGLPASIRLWSTVYGIGATASATGPSARSGATSRAARSRSPNAATMIPTTGRPDQMGRDERRRRRAMQHGAAAEVVVGRLHDRRGRRAAPPSRARTRTRARRRGRSARPRAARTRTRSRSRSSRRRRAAPRTGRDARAAPAWTTSPVAVTTVAPSSESAVRPCRRSSHPEPEPSVRPATPVSEIRPPVTASPCSCVAASSSPHSTPAPTRAVRRTGSTAIRRSGRRSITRPSSTTEKPASEWPPARTANGMSRSSANRSAAATSALEAARAISEGRRSIAPCQTRRAVSYSGWSGVTISPAKVGMTVSVRRLMPRTVPSALHRCNANREIYYRVHRCWICGASPSSAQWPTRARSRPPRSSSPTRSRWSRITSRSSSASSA